MTKIKAQAFNSTVWAVRAVLERDAWTNLLEKLDPGCRVAIVTPHPATDWLPAQYEEVLLAGLDNVTSHRAGVIAMDRDIKGIYRPFLRLFNLGFVINKAAAMWSILYQDNGTVRSEGGKGATRIIWESTYARSDSVWHNWHGAAHAIAAATKPSDLHTSVRHDGQGNGIVDIRWRA